jgi:O-antigen/teichoic acid export membrane protein
VVAAWRRSGVATRLGSGVFFNLLGAGFNQGSTLVVNLMVANLLGREIFGRYTMVVATVATVAAFGQLSMGYTATKHVAEFRSVSKERTSRILGLCAAVAGVSALLTAAALGLGAEWLAVTILGEPALVVELRIAALSVLFLVLNGFAAGALAGLESYRGLARAGVASGAVYLLVCIPLAWQYGLRGVVTGVAISAAAQTVLLAVLLRRESARQDVGLRFEGLWQERGLVTRFALPASLTGLITLPAVWLGSAILARQPDGFQHLALFGAANSFRIMVLFVPQAVNNVGMSIMNNSRQSSSAEYRQAFWINAFMTTMAAVGAALLVFAAATPLLELFGPAFRDGRAALGILLVSAVVEALTIAVYQVVVANSRIWGSLFAVSLPRDVTLVLLAALLSPRFGAAGLAAAHAVGWALALCGVLFMVMRVKPAPPVQRGMPVF